MHPTKPYGSYPVVWLAAAALFLPANSQSQWKTHWDYEGPKGVAHWSELDPAYATCNIGKEQSPIGIRKLYPHDVRPTQPLNGRVVQETQ